VSVPEAVLLGVVQGFTEFLPVSSSGHLVVGQALLGIELPGVAFEVAVHFATLVSVLVAYRRRVGALMRGSVRLDPETWRYLGLIALANVPAAAVYFLLGDVVEAAFETPAAAGVAFLVTGGVLWSARAALRRTPPQPAPFPGARGLGVALPIGVTQALALLPAISRPGSTVAAALCLRVPSDDAAGLPVPDHAGHEAAAERHFHDVARLELLARIVVRAGQRQGQQDRDGCGAVRGGHV